MVFGGVSGLSDMEHMYAILCVRIATTLSTETQIFNSPNLIKVDKIFGLSHQFWDGVNKKIKAGFVQYGCKASDYHLPRTG